MTAGEKKFVLWFALALLLWRVSGMPAVQNAFMQFLTVGQVPGTDITLSPKGVFLVVAALFSISLVAIFWSNLKRSFNKHRSVGTPEKITDGQPVVLDRRRQFAATPIPNPKLRLADKSLPLLYVPSIRPWLHKIRGVLKKAGFVLGKAAAAEYDSLKTIFTFIWRVVLFIGMAIWRFAEPRFRKFDKWLERKIRRSSIASEILEILEECWHAVTADRRKNGKTEQTGSHSSPSRSV